MALKLIQTDSSLIIATSLHIEVISEGFALITILFETVPPEKEYYGRYHWRYYGRAEPLTFYLDKRYVPDSKSIFKGLSPSQLTFFVDGFQSKQELKYEKESASQICSLPLFEIIEATEMSDGFSYEENGEFSTEYQNGYLICLLDDNLIDDAIRVSETVEVYLSKGCFSGIKLKLNELQVSELMESGLI